MKFTSENLNDLTLGMLLTLARHTRTSCSDQHSKGNEYANEFGVPRCSRCALLHRHKYGEFPYGVSAEIKLDIEVRYPPEKYESKQSSR